MGKTPKDYLRDSQSADSLPPKDYSKQIRGLFITAIILASLGFFSKLAAAAGLGALDPVKLIQTQLVARAGGQLGAARIASVINFLLDSLISLAVVLIAIAIGLINGYFDPAEGYKDGFHIQPTNSDGQSLCTNAMKNGRMATGCGCLYDRECSSKLCRGSLGIKHCT